jgi:hypothetical protein
VTSQDSLQDRYGAPAPWRRRALVAACTVLALVFLGWLGWTIWERATPDVESSMVGFEVVDEHTASARIDVRLADADVRASCRLRAYADDHTVVGERSITPVFGEDQPLSVEVRTERRATSVELIGCTAPGEPRPR